MAEADFEIQIPGLKDFFKWGTNKTNLPDKVRERIQRMKDAKSPVPGPLKWIPHVINQIDNAQDIAYTAAFLARPLLRRAPAKAIPYIGWGLRALEVANLATMILGIAMTPGLQKPNFAKTMKHLRRKLISDPKFIFKDFVGKPGWRGYLGFGLQAAQASETLTGKGMVLGKLMGAMSDTVWAGLRYAWEGKRTTWKAPKSDDPVTKAANFLSNTWSLINAKDILSVEDHQLIIAAQNLSHGILKDSGIPPLENRFDQMLSKPTLGQQPTDEVSRQVLIEEGFDPDGDIRPYYGDPDAPPPTVDEAIRYCMNTREEYANNLYNIMGSSENTWIWYEIEHEAAHTCIEHLTGIPPEQYETFDTQEIDIMHLTECSFMLDVNLQPQTLLAWYNRARYTADTRNHPTILCEDWLLAADYYSLKPYDKDEPPPEEPPPPPEEEKTCKGPDPGTGTIQGILSSSYDDAPIEGATVSIESIAYSDKTNWQGKYCTPSLSPDVYQLTFQAEGYAPKTYSIQVLADNVNNFYTNLNPI